MICIKPSQNHLKLKVIYSFITPVMEVNLPCLENTYITWLPILLLMYLGYLLMIISKFSLILKYRKF